MTTKHKPVTRAEILARLKKGPAQFMEFAKTRNNRSEARLVAIKLCQKLVDQGRICLTYIGKYRYYILNTDKGRAQAIQQHIEETSRIDKASGCTVWTGHSDKLRGPMMRQVFAGSGIVNVRRWLWEQKHGKLKANELVKMSCSCEEGCIDVDHMVKTDRSEIQKGRPKSIQQRIRLSKAKSEAKAGAYRHVDHIRSSTKTNLELAKETGLTPGNVSLIRRGKTFRFTHVAAQLAFGRAA